MNRTKQNGNVELGMVLLLIASGIFSLGFLLAETQTMRSCRDFGKVSVLGVLYECKKVETK